MWRSKNIVECGWHRCISMIAENFLVYAFEKELNMVSGLEMHENNVLLMLVLWSVLRDNQQHGCGYWHVLLFSSSTPASITSRTPHARRVWWKISCLPETYDELQLTTEATISTGGCHSDPPFATSMLILNVSSKWLYLFIAKICSIFEFGIHCITISYINKVSTNWCSNNNRNNNIYFEHYKFLCIPNLARNL